MVATGEVFAVLGNITSAGSRGTNRLIREGAKLVGGEDILDELLHRQHLRVAHAEAVCFDLTPQEAVAYALLAEAPLHIRYHREKRIDSGGGFRYFTSPGT